MNNSNMSIAANIVKDIRSGNRRLNCNKKIDKYNPETSGILNAEHRFYNESQDWMLLTPEYIKILCGIEVDNHMDVAYFNDGSVAVYKPTWNSDYSDIQGMVIVSPKYKDATKYFLKHGELIYDYEI